MPALWCNVLELADPSGAQLGGIAIWYLTFSTWNQSAIDFYRSIGGEPLNEWVGYRLTGEALSDAAISST